MENIVVEPNISMNHVGRIIEMISEIPYFKERNARVNKIENLPGGLTNNNFKVTVDGEMYAVRLAGDGTLEYLDREAEKHNAGLMSDMGINAKIIYYDASTGNQWSVNTLMEKPFMLKIFMIQKTSKKQPRFSISTITAVRNS